MKILHIVTSLELGGAEKLLTELLPEQKIGGNEIHLLILDLKGEIFLDSFKGKGILIHHTIIGNKKSYRNILEISGLIRRENFDIVHSHLTHAQIWTAGARTLDKKKERVYITTEHSTSNRRRGKEYFRHIDRWIYSKYNKVVCISKATEEELLNWIGSKFKSKMTVIENGISLLAFRGRVRDINLKEKEVKKLIMVSRFHRSKDHLTVVRVLEKLPKSYTLTFAGDGETMESVKREVMQLGLQDRVMFLGYTDEISKLFKTHDIAIQSSNYEGFGIGALEAMASGIPTIATDVPGLSEVVEGGGLLFKLGDVNDLYEKITELENREKYHKISKAGIERSNHFSIKTTAKKYVALYKKLMK
ncbi:MAG: glycosyltransferase family 4 protein [Cetobacterium sp.]|uniref:glycosyltransferase family 4 protein n=1 Tax=unclassified Cetobacterium TaxID=2630983 RepID=UPI00163BCA2D|nr:glycosyltransferase family 4 protein [Cetobacterium sp. 2A]MBC2856144.1 glycosyltransferase family 4 protein [Cetobacterium sp. 2A]